MPRGWPQEQGPATVVADAASGRMSRWTIAKRLRSRARSHRSRRHPSDEHLASLADRVSGEAHVDGPWTACCTRSGLRSRLPASAFGFLERTVGRRGGPRGEVSPTRLSRLLCVHAPAGWGSAGGSVSRMDFRRRKVTWPAKLYGCRPRPPPGVGEPLPGHETGAARHPGEPDLRRSRLAPWPPKSIPRFLGDGRRRGPPRSAGLVTTPTPTQVARKSVWRAAGPDGCAPPRPSAGYPRPMAGCTRPGWRQAARSFRERGCLGRALLSVSASRRPRTMSRVSWRTVTRVGAGAPGTLDEFFAPATTCNFGGVFPDQPAQNRDISTPVRARTGPGRHRPPAGVLLATELAPRWSPDTPLAHLGGQMVVGSPAPLVCR